MLDIKDINRELVSRGVHPETGGNLAMQAMQQSQPQPQAQMQPQMQGQAPAQPQQQGMSPFMSGVTGFNTGVERLSQGVLQMLSKKSPEMQKVLSKLAGMREEDFSKAQQANPLAANLGNFAGSVGASIPTMAIPGFGEGAVTRALTQGLIQGGLQGGAQYVAPGESRGMNTAIGSGVGGGLQALAQAIGAGHPLARMALQGLLGGMMGYGVTHDARGAEVGGLLGASGKFLGARPKGAALEMLEGIDKNKVQPVVEAGKRIGVQVTPGEAMGSEYYGKREGEIGKSPEGSQMMYEYGQKSLGQQKSAIQSLFEKIFPADQTNPATGLSNQESIGALYKKASAVPTGIVPGDISTAWHMPKAGLLGDLTQTNVMQQAIRKVENAPAYKDLLEKEGIQRNTVGYWDKVKQALDELGDKARSAGNNHQAKIIDTQRRNLVNRLDELSPDYKQARMLAEKQITRNTIESGLNEANQQGISFFNKFLKDDGKFEETMFHLRNAPDAQKALQDMRTVFQNLVGQNTARAGFKLAKTGMYQKRNFLEGAQEALMNLIGRRFDKAKVEMITNPDWYGKLDELAKTKDRNVLMGKLYKALATAATPAAINMPSDKFYMGEQQGAQ